MTVEPFYGEIGKLLMCSRHERDMTQEDVGAIIGLTRTSVVNIETGHQRIRLHTLIAIAAFIGMSPGALVDRALERVREAAR